MNLLETQELDIGYKRPAHVVATNLNLTLHAGELVCLLGPNGAGKSTLMRTIAGMQSPLGGTVTVQGEDIHQIPPLQRAKTLAIVLTERQTPAMLTGTATIALGRHPHTDFTGRFTEHDEAVVQWAIGAVNGQHLANKYLNTMSDGERQKIMIARALAQEPTLMLLDEPTAFLDLPRRVEMMPTGSNQLGIKLGIDATVKCQTQSASSKIQKIDKTALDTIIDGCWATPIDQLIVISEIDDQLDANSIYKSIWAIYPDHSIVLIDDCYVENTLKRIVTKALVNINWETDIIIHSHGDDDNSIGIDARNKTTIKWVNPLA